MKSTQLLEQIRETNLSYILLAQQLIREDKAEALVRLGIDENTAELLDQLTTAQVLRIAGNNMLMCNMRFEGDKLWSLLSNHTKDRSITGIHAAILMAGNLNEVAA